jgi:hypothetical protein
MTDNPAPDRPRWCQSFHPGHNVHWIHARHASQSERFTAEGVFVHDGWVHFTSNGITYSRWSHNVGLIPQLMERMPDANVDYCPRWNILYVETARPKPGDGGSSAMFYLGTEPTDCIGGEPYWPLGEVRVATDD